MAKFEAGHKFGHGRPKGSRNKRTEAFADVLKSHNFDPAEAILEMYEIARDELDRAEPEYKALYLKIAFDMVKEIASYTLPKVKAVELPTHNPLEGMSAQEKLNIIKECVPVLEEEVERENHLKSLAVPAD